MRRGMALGTPVESVAGGLDAWANFYVRDGTPVRWVSEVGEAEDPAVCDAGVRLVIGAQEELVLDMSRSMAAVLVAALGSARLHADLAIPASGDGSGGEGSRGEER